MRNILATLTLVLIFGALIATHELGPREEPASDWRRTATGWQRLDVQEPTETWAAEIHPAVVAGMVALVSLGALVVWEPSFENRAFSAAAFSRNKLVVGTSN